MRERNPFLLRTSERIQSDEAFLRLYSPQVIENIVEKIFRQNMWNQFFTFQSSPGGGKTTLLRLFTPSSLLTLARNQNNPDKKLEGLYKLIENIGAINGGTPTVIGAYLSCTKNYSILEDLSVKQHIKDRLFFGLINARVIISVLKSSIVLKNLTFPDDLEKLECNFSTYVDLPTHVYSLRNGRALFEWASSIEKNVYRKLDGFQVENDDTLSDDTLFSLLMFNPGAIKLNNQPIAENIVVMIDDAHQLSTIQRTNLRNAILQLRPPIGVWIAERLESHKLEDILPSGTIPNRDYGHTINLENEASNHQSKFEKVLKNIADKRIENAQDFDTGAFAQHLSSTLPDDEKFQVKMRQVLEVISKRVIDKYGNFIKYSKWIDGAKLHQGSLFDKLSKWRVLQVIIERDLKKAQQSLFEDEILLPEELSEREAQLSAGNSNYLLANEFDLPSYFWFSTLAIMSSQNIEQFLGFAGKLFEEIIAARIIGEDTVLSPERQEAILKSVAEEKWLHIKKMPNGKRIQTFLKAIADLAREEDNKPGFPYRGVTGIAIKSADRSRLTDYTKLEQNLEMRDLAELLSTCIANNLLEVKLDAKQGQKGSQTWMVMYLNRWICLKFALATNYGGWRPLQLETLRHWAKYGYKQRQEKSQ
jgi:hypothetical protein